VIITVPVVELACNNDASCNNGLCQSLFLAKPGHRTLHSDDGTDFQSADAGKIALPCCLRAILYSKINSVVGFPARVIEC
jgi:hypothetical protein